MDPPARSFAERWETWLAHDPVVKLEAARPTVRGRGLGAHYIDCGAADQFNLVYRRPPVQSAAWSELAIAHRYEEFPDNHTAVDYRMDESLPFLAKALTG